MIKLARPAVNLLLDYACPERCAPCSALEEPPSYSSALSGRDNTVLLSGVKPLAPANTD